MKIVYLLLHLAFMAIFSQAQLMVSQPHPHRSLGFNYMQNGGRCSFRVIIKTSCSSIQFTRDEISLSFGDAYGNQVYAPRIDNPTSTTFQRCTSTTFQIHGPCTYQICSVSFYRTGSDGWKPESIKIYGFNSRPVTFYYNTFLPPGVWFGFNHCSKPSHSSSSSSSS